MKRSVFSALKALLPLLVLGLLLGMVATPPPLTAQDLPSFFDAPEEDSSDQGGFTGGGFDVPGAFAGSSDLVWGGRLRAAARSHRNWSDPTGAETEARSQVELELQAAAAGADLVLRLRHQGISGNAAPSGEGEAVKDLVDEAYLRAYLGRFDFEAGLMKLVWGKGDDMHVVDVLNPTDYRDFVNNDYLERRRAELMFRLVGRFGSSSNLELVWAPITGVDRIPQGGRWVPGEAEQLQNLIDNIDETLPTRLRDGTWGLRWSSYFGGLDLGLLYAYSFHRTPSVDLGGFASGGPPDPAERIRLSYDRFHLFGLEASAAPGGFNLRAEGAFYLSEDLRGDDPRIKNSRAGYVLGLDRDLLPGQLNLNAQIRGLLTLNPGAIKRNETLNKDDTDYRENGHYSETQAALRLGGSFFRDKIKPEVSLTLGLEDRDYRLEPRISWLPGDDLELGLRYLGYGGKQSGIFGHFRDSSFLEIFAVLAF